MRISLRDVLEVDRYVLAALPKKGNGHGARHERQFDARVRSLRLSGKRGR
jgi:hypothetical protein